MVWSIWLACTWVVLLTARLRYAGDALYWASPVPMPVWLWDAMIAATGLGAAGGGWLARGRLGDPPGRRAAAEAFALPALLLGFVWGVQPAFDLRRHDVAFLVAYAGWAAALAWRDRRDAPTMGLTGRNFPAACRLLAIPTLVMIAVPVGLGLRFGAAPDPTQLAVSLLTYPFYAAAQMLVFLVLLVPRLRRLSDGPGGATVVAGGLFALVHWPNGPLMAGTFAAGLVWAAVYQRRANLWAVALSMGLAATAFNHALPAWIAQNTRMGPTYVERAMEYERQPPEDWRWLVPPRDDAAGGEPRRRRAMRGSVCMIGRH